MVRLDISGMPTLEVNRKLRELVQQDDEIVVENPHSVHNFATALKGKAKITVEGSAGFYAGGFLQGPTVIIKGNTGLYTGDNMGSGEIIVEMNTGSNCAPSMVGGTILIKGHSGSRAGWGMKGGNLIVCGNVGMWSGKMTLGGRIIILGKVGTGIGESMYGGVIHVLDPDVEEKLGGNVTVKPIAAKEKKEVETLFKKFAIEQSVDSFRSIMPKVYGRHDYVMFKPTHKKRAEV
ncbi:MAG: glutamate synthase [Deltaproteobacteria bacterium]|jgi:glutamate synthase domain-containing protein 3|nr:glutamate synthase [Deltaproteobacteria bacterium]